MSQKSSVMQLPQFVPKALTSGTLSQGSGSGLFENSAAVEVALVVEMVIDRGMDGGRISVGS